MIRGFFFDLDGTLVDTHQANFVAYKQALADIGIDIDFSDFKKTIGMQARNFLPMLAPGLKDKDYEDISTRKASYYKEHIHLSKLNEDLYDFMRSMSERYATALVTTAKKVNTQAVLEHHKLEKYLHTIITAEDVVNSKPSPECYLLALERSGLKPAEVIAFEDSETGRESAEAAGIPVVMIKDFAV